MLVPMTECMSNGLPNNTVRLRVSLSATTYRCPWSKCRVTLSSVSMLINVSKIRQLYSKSISRNRLPVIKDLPHALITAGVVSPIRISLPMAGRDPVLQRSPCPAGGLRVGRD